MLTYIKSLIYLVHNHIDNNGLHAKLTSDIEQNLQCKQNDSSTAVEESYTVRGPNNAVFNDSVR